MQYKAMAYTSEGRFQLDFVRDSLREKLEESSLDAMRRFSAGPFVSLEVKLDSILWLLGIPDWGIDAELVYMNWR